MARQVRRYGRGLNSFTMRTEYDSRTKATQAFTKKKEPQFYPFDPARYYVSGRGPGTFQVIDRDAGEAVAFQLDSASEAEEWIADHCAKLKAARAA